MMGAQRPRSPGGEGSNGPIAGREVRERGATSGAPPQAEAIELHEGDCLTVMPTLAAGSVDLILADLPYGTTACKWDSVIPLAPLWECYRRLVKPRGAVVLTASQPFTSALVMSNPGWFRYTLIWEKTRPNNVFNAAKMPMKYHEEIVVFYGSLPTYNPQMEQTERRTKVLHARTNREHGHLGRTGERAGYVHDNGGRRHPSSVLRFSNVCRPHVHPTQKPVALMEYLIRTYTNEGDLVLDNTMGSGTTGVAAVRTGRRFVGIERDPEYYRTALDRIAAAVRGEPEIKQIIPVPRAPEPDLLSLLDGIDGEAA